MPNTRRGPAQVSGEAGEMQIEGARRAATLNIGGSTATTVSFIVERSEARLGVG